MSVLNNTTRTKLATKAAKGALRRPGMALAGARGAAPIAKRRARRRIGSIGDTAREYGELLVTHGPSAAQELGTPPSPSPSTRPPAWPPE